ncbi:MAG TPA: hypothetical protein VG406_28120 [Isosphaeraceae bacterium]|jgi:hypothetical protein|nr:hypothetical protein [Isosphaeraceae bacterium]
MIGLAPVLAVLAMVGDDAGISLPEIPAYKAALEADPAATAVAVAFRDLWQRPEEFRGRRVRVEGTVTRRFRAPASGRLPPRVEVWITAASGDLICLVHPDVRAGPEPAAGTSVRFAGTFLKRVSYQGGDVARLAPLIVGPGAPVAIDSGPVGAGRQGRATLDWAVGAVLAAGVLLFLGRQHLGRPAPRRADRDLGARPEFLDDRPGGGPGGDGDERVGDEG